MKRLLFLSFLLPITLLASEQSLEVKSINGESFKITKQEALKALSKSSTKKYIADLEQFDEDSILYVNPKIKYGNKYISLGATSLKLEGPHFCNYIEQGDYLGGKVYEWPQAKNDELVVIKTEVDRYILNFKEAGLVTEKVESIACKTKKEQRYYFNADTNSLFSM